MAGPYNRTHIAWPLYKRFLVIICLILFIIGVIVISVAVPVSLTDRDDHTTQSIVDVAPPFHVTYLLTDKSIRSTTGLNLDSIDRVKVVQSFEQSLGLSLHNILHLVNIFSNTAIRRNSQSRRKRFIQCDQDSNGMSGPVLIFDFNLTYPFNRTCQNQNCINEVYQQFKSVQSLSIDFGNVRRSLRLCSFGVLAYASTEPTISNTQNLTTVSSKNEGFNMSTSSIQISTVNVSSSITAILSTDIPNVNVSSATIDTFSNDMPDVNVSSTIDISSSDIPDVSASLTMNISSTETSDTIVLSIMKRMAPIENSNFTSNETNVDIDVCLKKLPITQEQVSPYRITYTSTLFFQDNHSLIVVGASKFENFLENQTVKREIVIDGVMVSRNCQRTLDVSLPMICHDSASS